MPGSGSYHEAQTACQTRKKWPWEEHTNLLPCGQNVRAAVDFVGTWVTTGDGRPNLYSCEFKIRQRPVHEVARLATAV